MPRVALFSPCGHGNLGDAAIQDSVIAAARERIPNVELVGITLVPDDTERRHGIPAYPLGALSRPRYGIVPPVLPRDPRRPGPVEESGQARPPSTSSGTTQESRPRNLASRLTRLGVSTARPFLPRNFLWSARVEAGNVLMAHRLMGGLDALLVSGGGQLDDFWGGPWGQPWALFKWCGLARAKGVPVAFLSVGTGTVDHPLSRLMLGRSLRWARWASYRDTGSRDLMRRAGHHTEHPVFPDLAFGVPWSGDRPTASNRPPRIAVSPIPWGDPRTWPAPDTRAFDTYMSRMTLLVIHLLDAGADVALVSSDGPDRRTVGEIEARVRGCRPGARLDMPATTSVHAFLRVAAEVDAMVASRMHGILLTLVAGTPVVGLSYDRKVAALMADSGQRDLCSEIGDLDPAATAARILGVLAEGSARREAIAHTVARFRALVSEQYDRVFRLLELSA